MGLDAWCRAEGFSTPLGVTWIESFEAYNFALYASDATVVSLLLYSGGDFVNPIRSFTFDFPAHKTARVWHMLVPAAEIEGAKYYAYKVDGPFGPGLGERFDRGKVLLDPYARGIFLPPAFSREAARAPGPNDGKAPLGILPLMTSDEPVRADDLNRHTHDLVIYELHVRNFTRHPSAGLDEHTRGTYAGVAAMIPYLKDLGVTAVELMPVHQYDPQEGSYWGYMTLGFFAAHHGYARNSDAEAAAAEFKAMVKAFHAADIEVILDVVYNHTTETDQTGPTYSFRGIDNSTYYALDPKDLSHYFDFSACGNDLRTSHPAVRRFVVDSLRYWATEMGVDGFRFDLASVFMRDDGGTLNYHDPAIISAISADAILADRRLIAEPWQGELGGGYVLGRAFPGLTWQQWNGKFRDDVRQFVKGDSGLLTSLMTRLHGSTDLFPDTLPNACRPSQSVNFVTSHDGLCLYDLVAYTNGVQASWNCGWEGDADVPPEVAALRKRQIKNFCCLLMLSSGVPMLAAGDEFMNTQRGNDNPYNEDGEIVWLDWRRLDANPDMFRFFKTMIAFRKAHPSISRSTFWNDDVRWHGVSTHPDISYSSHTLAFFLRGGRLQDSDLYAMINCYWEDLDFTVSEGEAHEWSRVVDTSRESPNDILEPGAEEPLASLRYRVCARSIVVLIRPLDKSRPPSGTSNAHDWTGGSISRKPRK
jgi:isoamylase